MSEATTVELQMKDALKPYSLGEILDRTVQIYRRNFLLFVGIAALPTLLIIVTAGGAGLSVGWLGRTRTDTASLIVGLIFILLILIFFPLWITLQSIANGALTVASVRMHEGGKIKVREALGAAWKRGWRYIGTEFFTYLFAGIIPAGVFFGLFMLTSILGALAGTAGGSSFAFMLVGLLIIFGTLVFAVFIILAMIRLSLAFAACTVEEMGPWNSIKRSYDLTKGSMGRIFLFGLLVYALTVAITLVFMVLCIIPFIVVEAMSNGQGSEAQQRLIGVAVVVVYYAAVFLAQIAIKPIYSIGLTVFYFDERVRKEGYDIEWMMKRAGLVEAGAMEVHMSSSGAAGLNQATQSAGESVPWLDAAQRFEPNAQPPIETSLQEPRGEQ